MLQGLSNEELEASLNGLLGAGARVEARIVAHLAEVEARRVHLLAGYSSLYDYCRKRLGLSDYEAFVRIAAARVARRYPVVFGMLERRELHLTAICEVRDFLSVENHGELLREISGKTKLQIREILARRFPQADVPTSLKKLPPLEPLSPGRYRLLLTLSAEQKEKLELARDLLSHANPIGDFAIVVERALDELTSRLEKRRFGQAAPRPTRESANLHVADLQGASAKAMDHPADSQRAAKSPTRRRRHIGHETRRQVLARDGGCCAFVSDDGQRCNARAFLQFHHKHAWARGGIDGVDNLALFCQAHNRLLAERDFGSGHIDRIIAQNVSAAKRTG